MTTHGPERGRDRRIFRVLVALTVLVALIVQSAFFFKDDWMLGDMAYHRGVAYSMMGGDLQGSGPFAGLISYYGGLFPLMIAGLMKISPWDFEAIVSIMSWLSPLTLVAAFALLGRHLWPKDGTSAGLVALFGTLAGALSLAASDQWVDSVMVGSHNYWPVYPRDLALSLVVAASAFAIFDSRVWRVAGVGVSLGLAILFHAQMGAIAGLIVLAMWMVRAWKVRGGLVRAFVDAITMFVIVLAVAGWWLWPRVAAAYRSGLQLKSFPGGEGSFAFDPVVYLAGFGIVGILAMVALFRWILGSSLSSRRLGQWVSGWLIVTVPIAVLGTIAGDLGVITARRGWLLVSPALVVLATDVLAWTRMRVIKSRFVLFVTLVLLLALGPVAVATVPHVRGLWEIGDYQGRELNVAAWTPVWNEIRQDVEAGESPQVLASDAFSGAVWSWSGGHVASMLLPGYVKLGFGLQDETGWSYVDRVTAVDEAFQAGLSGICSLAFRRNMTHVLLENRDGLLSVRDTNPAAVYRLDPEVRTEESVEREVMPGVDYVDANAFDGLLIRTGVEYQLPEWALESEMVVIEFITNPEGHDRLLQVRQGESLAMSLQSHDQFQRVRIPVNQSDHPVVVYAERPLMLTRIIGFEDPGESDLDALVKGEMSLYETESLCRGER